VSLAHAHHSTSLHQSLDHGALNHAIAEPLHLGPDRPGVAVTPPSRAEDECQSYVIYEAVETPNTFIFVEEWASLDGLYAHFHTPHFTEFFAALGEVIAGPPVGTVSEVSSTRTLDDAFAAAGIGG
jgi:quinol monooxygenase YgiN